MGSLNVFDSSDDVYFYVQVLVIISDNVYNISFAAGKTKSINAYKEQLT